MLKNFSDIKTLAAGRGQMSIAIAAAEDTNTIRALKDLREHLPVKYYLVGDMLKVNSACAEAGLDAASHEIIATASDEESASKAVELCKNGTASILMKGELGTATLLKAVLCKENGIRQGGLISHLAVLECPTYHKLMFMTDGGINPTPDLDKKQAILENTIQFMHRLGLTNPKVAALCAVETISDKMPETVDAAELVRRNQEGEITGCLVEGPLSFDLAISAESAKIKGIKSQVAGDADVFLMPNISTGNVMSKALLYLAGAKMAGCVLGVKVPIVLTSRGATAEEKLLSFLLTLAAC